MTQNQNTNSDEQKFLLIVNDNDGTVRVAANPSGHDKQHGNVRTASPKDSTNQFLVLEGRDMMDEFIRNYQRQYNYPQGLRWFYAPFKAMENMLNKLVQVKEGEKPAKVMDEFASYEKKASFKHGYSGKEMDKMKKDLAELGYSGKDLNNAELMKTLNRGEPLPPIMAKIKSDIGTIEGKFSPRIVRNPKTGKPSLKVEQCHHKATILNKPYMGHEFTKEDKAAFSKSRHLGRPVELTDPQGRKFMALISLHPYTHQPYHAEQQYIRIPANIKNMPIDKATNTKLHNGGTLESENFTVAGGNKFGAKIQYDAFMKKIDFDFKTVRLKRTPDRLGGVTFTDQMKKDYEAGKRVDLGDPKSSRPGSRIPPMVYKGADGIRKYAERTPDEQTAYDAKKQASQKKQPTPEQGKPKNTPNQKPRKGPKIG